MPVDVRIRRRIAWYQEMATNPDPEHWRRLDELLREALALPAEARADWLAARPDADQPLLPRLRRMLERTGAEADSFMSRPAAAEWLEAGDGRLVEGPGTFVGPYRLLRELGTGGMGRVWLAERADGEWQRQVALKLPRSGWARGVAERLVQERDALAALEHPNIARLYDAGTADGGRPFIAMEYVDGRPINEYVQARGCDLRQRLELFLQVASAVAYAHSHLIVHRDIKPQNILVTEDGVAHLLDFGAAKLLGRDDDAMLTRQVGGAMSPDYASPEQIRGERITVASDVYSLGVLLYELLTDERPYRLRRQGAAALEAAIDAVDIPPASSRAGLHPRHARQLRGDLDAILGRALRRRPESRYSSVQALADDVGRHLAGEPVQAQPPGRLYLLRKFARRHRLFAGAAAAVLVAISAGALVSLWQASIARQEAARAARVKDFVTSIFTQAVPKTGVGGSVTATDLLAVAAHRLDTELADDPAVASELGLIIANSYDALGYTQETIPILRRAVDRADRAFGPYAAPTLDARIALVSSTMLGDPQGTLRETEALLPHVGEASDRDARRRAELLRYYSFILAKLDRRQDSYGALLQGIELGERRLGEYDEDTIRMLGLLSNTYGRFGDREPQLASATEAYRRAIRAYGRQRPHNTLTAVERWYADALRENDRPGDAVPILRRVLEDQQRLDAAPTQRVRFARMQLGSALFRTGEAAEALALIREAHDMERAQNPTDTDDRRAASELLAAAYALGNRIDDALAVDAFLDGLVLRLGGEPEATRVSRALRRARMLDLAGRPAEAVPLLDEVDAHAPASNADRWITARLARAFHLRLAGEPTQALEILDGLRLDPRLARQRLALRSNVAGEQGLSWLALGRADRAAAPLEDCQRLFLAAQILPSVRSAGCLLGLARVRLAQRRPAEAIGLLTPLVRSWESINPGSPWHGEALFWLAQAQRAADDARAGAAEANLQRARAMLVKAGRPVPEVAADCRRCERG